MKKNDEYFMKIAIKEAQKAYDIGEIPVGAIIVKNNKIISRGYNLKEIKNNAIKHAEIVAIEKACKKLQNWRLVDCIIYITMLPCPMCASAINQSRISKIVYGTSPQYAKIELINNILKDKKYGLPVEINGSILEKECTSMLKKFFKEKR